MSRWWLVLPVILAAAPVWAQELPLRTENTELLNLGQVQVNVGVEFLHRQRYSLSGLEGDLMRLGVTTIRVGVGEYAEFQISGVMRDFLTVARRTPAVISPKINGDSTSDFGDLILGTKLKLAGEKGARPALGFQFAVQLPNASNESGLGTDETKFYARILLSKRAGRAQVLGNLGLAILGSPVQANSQADMITYGAGFILPVRNNLDLVGEFHGRTGPERIGNESLSQVQIGTRLRFGAWSWDVAGVAGLEHYSPAYGITIGVAYNLQAFRRKGDPKTIRPPGKY